MEANMGGPMNIIVTMLEDKGYPLYGRPQWLPCLNGTPKCHRACTTAG